MTEPLAADRAPAAPPADRSPKRSSGPDRLIAASTVAAWVCIALTLIGLVIGSIPVRTPKVQDCGAPLVFVLTGRVDTFVDPGNPPKGVTADEAKAANARPCRKRVAPRTLRSAEFLGGGLVAGLAGVVMVVIGRSARRKALLRDLPATPAPAAASPSPPGSGVVDRDAGSDLDGEAPDRVDPP